MSEERGSQNWQLSDEEIQELKRLKKLYETPIDFDQLIEDGILESVGGNWYRILDAEKVPEHVTRKGKALRDGPEGVEIKLPS